MAKKKFNEIFGLLFYNILLVMCETVNYGTFSIQTISLLNISFDIAIFDGLVMVIASVMLLPL